MIPENRHPSASLPRLAVLWLAGADLRVTMLAVPPVLPLIHRDLGLSEKAIGALSGLPILLLGLAAIPGSLLIARIGARRAATAGLLFVAATAAARGLGPSAPMLFGMTVLMAIGIAIIQPALPTLVGEWFPRMPGFASALYANGLLVGEAVPAALTIPLILPLVGGSWPASFALWSVPLALTALMIAFGTSPAARPLRLAPARWWPEWRSPLPWQLGLLTGGSGGLYFSANAFIPDYLHATGRPELVAAALGALNTGQLPASILLLFVVRRLSASRVPFVAMPLLTASCLFALLAPADWSIIAGALAMGFFGAFTLILTLSLPPQLAEGGDVHRLSAGMFTIGYGLTCTIPLLGGVLWDLTGIPATAFLAGALSSALGAAAGVTLRLKPAPNSA